MAVNKVWKPYAYIPDMELFLWRRITSMGYSYYLTTTNEPPSPYILGWEGDIRAEQYVQRDGTVLKHPNKK